MGKTLVEVLADNWNQFPDGAKFVYQGRRGVIYGVRDDYDEWICGVAETATDWSTARVTRAQWEAERARIAKEDSLANLASLHKHEAVVPDAAEDQALWDQVAALCYADCVHGMSSRFAAMACAFDDADAFMAERAKRMMGERCSRRK